MFAHAERKRAGWRSNPRLRLFRPALGHLSYQPNNEKTRCRLRHRVLEIPQNLAKCHKRKLRTGSVFAG